MDVSGQPGGGVEVILDRNDVKDLRNGYGCVASFNTPGLEGCRLSVRESQLVLTPGGVATETNLALTLPAGTAFPVYIEQRDITVDTEHPVRVIRHFFGKAGRIAINLAIR